jgi:hypothetical protein
MRCDVPAVGEPGYRLDVNIPSYQFSTPTRLKYDENLKYTHDLIKVINY